MLLTVVGANYKYAQVINIENWWLCGAQANWPIYNATCTPKAQEHHGRRDRKIDGSLKTQMSSVSSYLLDRMNKISTIRSLAQELHNVKKAGMTTWMGEISQDTCISFMCHWRGVRPHRTWQRSFALASSRIWNHAVCDHRDNYLC